MTRILAVGLSAGLAFSIVPVSSAASAPRTSPPGHQRAASQVLLDWETTAIRTVYTENATAVPVGALYLGFTSLSMGDAVRHARDRGRRRGKWLAAVQTAASVLGAFRQGGFTEGLVEARDRSGLFFPLDRHLAQPRASSLDESLEALIASLLSHTGRFMKDDLALVLAESRVVRPG